MNKILLCLTVSALPLAISLDQVNATLKFQNILQGKWVENNQVEKENLSTSKKSKKIKNIYHSKKININLLEDSQNKRIAEIHAKKVQKKYYLALKNDYFYSDNELENFIKTKFYIEKTTKYYIASEDFYSFLDTKETNGEITKNGMIQFRSSWGVFNNKKVISEIKFNFLEETIKKFIFLHNRSVLPNNLKLRQMDVESIRPTKIGILPIVQIYQPPILNATFETWSALFNDYWNSKNYPDFKQDLIMPDGHNNGAEWWRDLVSAVGPIVAMLGGGLGAVIGGTILKSLLAGALISGVSQIISKIVENIENISINESISSVKKIYEKIIQNSFEINPLWMNFNDLPKEILSMSVLGEIWAQANATSIWGSESKMNLFAVWGAVNSNVWYRVYS